ncbi:hypothetical protein CTAYLR_002267 [Chrysophaeum taylorii]|uniref:Uncharacterized protein n=1 Tax=Chrysophaeum taylorii TaxID=2483200 RepID=A0AAD7UNS7_9STRA|nr:hypothetical protein CTAYLR_002267 [Chrysophaeum taylorii]
MEETKHKHEAGGSVEQAERNYQLIENLMVRLQKMGAKAEERRRACEEDQNADSEMCSSKVPTLQQDMDERDSENPMCRKPSMFLRESENGVPEINVTWRSAPTTEAGKRLEAKFEEEVGHLFASTQKRIKTKTISAANIGRSRRHDHKLDEKKQERIKYERRLQSNLEHYVTRAVNELHYQIPASGIAHSGCPDDDDDADEDEFGSPDKSSERWPIPVESQQMNPRLLLAYSTERIMLPSGVRMFKHFALCHISCQLYVYLYWFAHCRFFQDNSIPEQHHLLRRVATLYVKLLSLRALEAHRDFFFKYYPYVVANAIFAGFYYLCPGSRHLYTNAFKKILYLQLAQILTGLDVCPSSVQVLRHHCFPDDVADDDHDDDADSLPPLPMHTSTSAPDTTATGVVHRTNNDGAGDAVPPRAGDVVDGGSTTMQSNLSSSLLASRTKPDGGGGGDDHCRMARRSVSMPALARPVGHYVGSRSDLRFRPAAPANLRSVLPRQRKVGFDTSQLSPLLHEYLSTNPRNKNKNSVRRTAPVHWCYTGGTETFVKMSVGKTFVFTKAASGKEVHETFASYEEAKQEYSSGMKESHRERSAGSKRLAPWRLAATPSIASSKL